MVKYHKYLPYIAGLSYATIFGFSFIVVRSSLDGIMPFQLLGLRFLVAAIVFIVLRMARAVKISITLKESIRIIPIAFFLPILYFLFETFGIMNTSAGEAGLFVGLIPVAVVFLSRFFLNEKMQIEQIVFMVISLLGIVLISIYQLNEDGISSNTLGCGYMMAAVISAAIYNVLSKKATEQFSPIDITYVMMIIGAIFFNILGIAEASINNHAYIEPLRRLDSLASILYLGVFSSVFAFFLMNYTLSKTSATQNSLFTNLSTVIAFIMGIVLLDEAAQAYKIVGSSLIVTGLWGSNYFKDRRNNQAMESQKKTEFS